LLCKSDDNILPKHRLNKLWNFCEGIVSFMELENINCVAQPESKETKGTFQYVTIESLEQENSVFN